MSNPVTGPCVLAHDVGTSGSKAALYAPSGELLAAEFSPYNTFYPDIGWAEQEPEDWWAAICQSTRALLDQSGIDPGQIAAVSFSGQMMACLPLDRAGNPLGRAMIWADQRSEPQAAAIRDAVGADTVYALTGHRLSPSYTLSKMLWLREQAPEVFRRTAIFVQAKDFAVYRLTGCLATDYSDASGMNLLDLRKGCWAEALLAAADLDPGQLPQPRASTEVVGRVHQAAAEATGLRQGTPVVIGAGDGVCASVGAGVVEPGQCYSYIGSSAWVAAVDRQPFLDPSQALANFAHMQPGLYMPCGSMQSAGASYEWIRQILGITDEELCTAGCDDPYAVMDYFAAQSKPGADGLLYLPYLMGERTPYWDPTVRGALLGLTIRHQRRDILRAVLEGVAYHLRLIVSCFEPHLEVPAFRLIGGGAKGALWCQIVANICRRPVRIPRFVHEATSLGAAMAGAVGVGLLPSLAAATECNPIAYTYQPELEAGTAYEPLYQQFCQAYHVLRPLDPANP